MEPIVDWICTLPPSTNSSTPVTKLESSDARYSAALATGPRIQGPKLNGFDGYRAADMRIDGVIHDTHRPATQLPDNAVPANCGPSSLSVSAAAWAPPAVRRRYHAWLAPISKRYWIARVAGGLSTSPTPSSNDTAGPVGAPKGISTST
jgi:hypothetical protein